MKYSGKARVFGGDRGGKDATTQYTNITTANQQTHFLYGNHASKGVSKRAEPSGLCFLNWAKFSVAVFIVAIPRRGSVSLWNARTSRSVFLTFTARRSWLYCSFHCMAPFRLNTAKNKRTCGFAWRANQEFLYKNARCSYRLFHLNAITHYKAKSSAKKREYRVYLCVNVWYNSLNIPSLLWIGS